MQSSNDEKHSLVLDIIGYPLSSQDFPSSKQIKFLL